MEARGGAAVRGDRAGAFAGRALGARRVPEDPRGSGDAERPRAAHVRPSRGGRGIMRGVRLTWRRVLKVLLAALILAAFFLSSLARSHPAVGNDEVIPPDEESKIAGIVSSSIRLSELYRKANEVHR